ncbi:hypothetical protein ONE63_010347 [Megalurothrips usitatus]|uniref:Uncharacterized protein n=1 Tax=Megalurothrips usitatus TaxID=439358 RepID=A0AAV7XQ39_9NEOP|nr:hypothetical protein ONE63_010347 [Megalurothrips usitatus]
MELDELMKRMEKEKAAVDKKCQEQGEEIEELKRRLQISKDNERKYLCAMQKEEALGLAVQDQAVSQEEQIKKLQIKCNDLKDELCAATEGLKAADKLNEVQKASLEERDCPVETSTNPKAFKKGKHYTQEENGEILKFAATAADNSFWRDVKFWEQNEARWNEMDDGDHLHNAGEPVGNQCRGKDRAEVKEQLKHCAPRKLKRDQLAAKVQKQPQDVAAGNYAGIFSTQQLQEMASENNVQDKATELFASLALEKKSIEEKYGKNTVYILSHTPFQIAWSTPNMAELPYKLSCPREKIIGHIDSSGAWKTA